MSPNLSKSGLVTSNGGTGNYVCLSIVASCPARSPHRYRCVGERLKFILHHSRNCRGDNAIITRYLFRGSYNNCVPGWNNKFGNYKYRDIWIAPDIETHSLRAFGPISIMSGLWYGIGRFELMLSSEITMYSKRQVGSYQRNLQVLVFYGGHTII